MTHSAGLLFLDTSYLNALINSRDQWHADAVRWERQLASSHPRFLTTDFILIEFANILAAVRFRREARATIDILRSSSTVEIIPASTDLFDAGLDLYVHRSDKDWGLTDCISFVVMQERGLQDALSSDEHFRQAGFRPLLIGM